VVTRTQRRVSGANPWTSRRVVSISTYSPGRVGRDFPVDAARPVFNFGVTNRAVVDTGISWMMKIIHDLSDIKCDRVSRTWTASELGRTDSVGAAQVNRLGVPKPPTHNCHMTYVLVRAGHRRGPRGGAGVAATRF
jgi:hypothetical protein